MFHLIWLGLVAGAGAALASPEWEAVLDRVVPAVVSLRVSTPRSFDLSNATTSVATGFIVDAEQGLILTNRHVVGPGPAVAEAVFQDNEEVPVTAVYRDPVHDFGFFRFDPNDVRFMDVVDLELAPEAARVGAEIRIVGSDAGEKISILPGILARLDRPAPTYGRGRYNDFNTFYYQAASGTSGGSSGSPVLDVVGRVVALNAGSRRNGASSYFLPLDRIVRVLDLVRRGEPVARGTLQTVLGHKPYDEVRRLGLPPEIEAEVRAAMPDGTGMLVVDEVLPAGPADGRLRPGDVVVRVDGALVTAFVPLEAVLDDNVGGRVTLELCRGGQMIPVEVTVQDLHSVTPSEYLEVGGAVLHELSYQQALGRAVPVEGVVVASSGYMLSSVGADAVITEIAGGPVPDLAAAERLLAGVPDGERIPVRFHELDDPRRQRVAVVDMDRHWFEMQRCRRDDATGEWPCTRSPEPPAPGPPPVAETSAFLGTDRASRTLAPSFVTVRMTLPFRTEGVYGETYRGTGLVVDAERGWVLVDRDTVPVAMGDVHVVFGASVEVPARVVWMHPTQNLALIAYDPASIGDTPVRSARFVSDTARPGDPIRLVGLSQTNQVLSRRTRVERVNSLDLPLPRPPFFRPINMDVIDPVDVTSTMGGVLADRRGRVAALWASFVQLDENDPTGTFFGLSADVIVESLSALRAGPPDRWPVLGFELGMVSLAEARDRGLDDETARALEAHDPTRRQVLAVVRRAHGSPAAEVLRDQDLVLAAEGQPVTRFRELESLVWQGTIPLTVLRDGKLLDLELPVMDADTLGTTRAVRWAGTLVHAPHAALAFQRGLPQNGVYVAWYWFGSPAARYGLRPTRRIVAVDDVATPDLDAFVAAVSGRPDRSAVRVTTVNLDNQTEVVTLKLDRRYWPTSEIALTAQGWTRRDLD